MASVFFTRMMVADMVTDLGHTVAAEAGDLPSALEHANKAAFDLAVLDVRLGRDSMGGDALRQAGRQLPCLRSARVNKAMAASL